jgi:DNA-3-methyladenine glycosylase
MILPRAFYERDTLEVASGLLGQVLVRETSEGTARGVIVETEAYLGERDDAAHSYKGKSERVRVQYGPAGLAYIYMIYGIYHCLNITSGPAGAPEVVLIRALEPAGGLELMKKRRGTDRLENLCSGPGKLCMALDINREQYGADLCEKGGLHIENGGTPAGISTSRRIGIDYAVSSRDKPWRFCVAGSKFLSRPG